MADRWTEETEDALAAEFDRSWRGIKILKCDPERLAREALTFLAERGLLVPPGGRVFVEVEEDGETWVPLAGPLTEVLPNGD